MKTRLFPLFKSSVCSPSVLAASIAALVGSHFAQANTTNNFFQNSAMVTATNYSTGALPTATDDVVLTTVSLTPSINASTAIVFGSLDVLNGSTYTITNNSSVTNSTFKLGSATLANAQIGAAAADLIYLSNNSNLTITGTNTAATPRTLGLVLGGSGNFNASSGSTLNISAAITGAFVLTKTGVGALTLGGTVNPSAGLVINDGTVTMSLNNATSQAPLTVNSPGILNFNNGQIFGVLNDNGTINENGNFLYTRSAATGSFSGTINGTGGYIKDSTGTQTLSGANTYSGGTSVGGGKLLLGSGGSLAVTAVTVGAGTFGVAQNASGTTNAHGGSLTMNSGSALTMGDTFTSTLNVAGAANLYAGTAGTAPSYTFDISGTNGVNDTLAIGGVANLTNAGAKISINALGALTVGNTNTLVTGGAGSSLATNGLSLSTASAVRVVGGGNAYSVSLANTATTSILTVNSNSGAAALYWSGSQNAVWNTSNAGPVTNWNTDATSGVNSGLIPTSGTDVYFTTSTPVATNLTNTLGADTSIYSLNFTAASGPVVIGAGNNLTLGVGGLTNLSGSNQTINAPIVLAGNQTWTNSSAGTTLTIGGIISGSFALAKTGTGTLTLSGANTYTGATSITGGTLKLSGAGTLGVGSSVSVSSGALLDLNGTNQSIKFVAGTGVGTVANNFGSGISTLTLSTSPGGAILIQDSTANPGGKVAVVVTVSTQSLNNSNSYSGGTTVNGGAFLYLNSAPLGAGTGAINLTTALTSGLVSDPGVSIANDVSGPGYVSINQQANGTLTLTGNLTNTGNYTFRNTPVVQAYNFAGNGTTSTLSGVIGGPGGTNGGAITGSITKSGTGILSLSGASLYTGGTTLSAGVLNINSAGVAGTNGPLGNGGTFTINGGTIDNTSGTAKVLLNVNPITVGGDFAYSTSGGTSSNNLTLPGSVNLGGATRTITTNGTGTLTLSGAIIGTGSLTKDGPGTLTLSGGSANTYTGNTTVSAGTLSLSSAYLADASTLTIATGAFLNLNYTGTDIVASLNLGGSVQTTGTFDSTNSGGLITGTGKIQVGAATANYASWATARGITGEPPSGDFDTDGLSNLVEYALGLEPTQANGSAGTFTGNILSFTKGSEAFANGDLTYEIEASTTLETWSVVVANNPAQSTITYTLPTGLPKTFARLKVTQIP